MLEEIKHDYYQKKLGMNPKPYFVKQGIHANQVKTIVYQTGTPY